MRENPGHALYNRFIFDFRVSIRLRPVIGYNLPVTVLLMCFRINLQNR